MFFGVHVAVGVSWGPAGSSLAPGARSGGPLPHFPAMDHGWTGEHTLPLAEAFTYTSRIELFDVLEGMVSHGGLLLASLEGGLWPLAEAFWTILCLLKDYTWW